MRRSRLSQDGGSMGRVAGRDVETGCEVPSRDKESEEVTQT